jgi:hypothetical protein
MKEVSIGENFPRKLENCANNIYERIYEYTEIFLDSVRHSCSSVRQCSPMSIAVNLLGCNVFRCTWKFVISALASPFRLSRASRVSARCSFLHDTLMRFLALALIRET